MPRQLMLFERLPRAPRRVMMHPLDAGQGMALFRCKRCGAESGWIEVATLTQAMRGIPCASCNRAAEAVVMEDQDGRAEVDQGAGHRDERLPFGYHRTRQSIG